MTVLGIWTGHPGHGNAVVGGAPLGDAPAISAAVSAATGPTAVQGRRRTPASVAFRSVA